MNLTTPSAFVLLTGTVLILRRGVGTRCLIGTAGAGLGDIATAGVGASVTFSVSRSDSSVRIGYLYH